MAGKKGMRSRKVAVISGKRSRLLRKGQSMDMRSRDARYMRATLAALCSDLGGAETLSVQKQVLASECAWTIARLRRMKWDRHAGKPFDDKSYSALLNSLIGMFGKLGLERKAKRVASAQEMIAAEDATP